MPDFNNLDRREFLKLAAGAGAATVVIATGLGGYAYAAGSYGSGLGTGTLPEQVHLTWGADSSTEMTVSWVSPNPQVTPQLTLTPSGGSPVVYSGPQVTFRPYTDALSQETVYCYHVPLTGLSPGGAYAYTVEDAGGSSAATFSSSFTMAQAGRFAFAFTSFGDLATPGTNSDAEGSGINNTQGTITAQYTLADGSTVNSTTYSESQWNAYQAVSEVESLAPLFHLMNGDLAYADKEAVPTSTTAAPSGYVYQPAPEVWRDFGLNTQRSAANRPWMPAIGNHEAELGNGPNGYAAFNSRYLVPNNGSSSFNGNYYSFTVGSVLFISLDANDVCYQGAGGYNVSLGTQTIGSTTYPAYAAMYNRQYTGALGAVGSYSTYPGTRAPGNNVQTQWLANTLANARTPGGPIDWIVVVMHQCACSSTTDNGCDLGIREAWLPLFFRYGVDLVLNGHDHDYERTWPVNGFSPVSQGTSNWTGGYVWQDGNGTQANVPSTNGASLNTLTPTPSQTYAAGTTTFNTQQEGTVFMTIGGGGTNKPDNAYETNGTAQVTTFTQVRTGAKATGQTTTAGTKPTPDAIESQSWSAVTDTTDAYGVGYFSVNPGTTGGYTTLSITYFHTPTTYNTGTKKATAPTATNTPATGAYTSYDSFTLTRPRADSPDFDPIPGPALPELRDPALVLAATAAVAGGSLYLANRLRDRPTESIPTES